MYEVKKIKKIKESIECIFTSLSDDSTNKTNIKLFKICTRKLLNLLYFVKYKEGFDITTIMTKTYVRCWKCKIGLFFAVLNEGSKERADGYSKLVSNLLKIKKSLQDFLFPDGTTEFNNLTFTNPWDRKNPSHLPSSCAKKKKKSVC